MTMMMMMMTTWPGAALCESWWKPERPSSTASDGHLGLYSVSTLSKEVFIFIAMDDDGAVADDVDDDDDDYDDYDDDDDDYDDDQPS